MPPVIAAGAALAGAVAGALGVSTLAVVLGGVAVVGTLLLAPKVFAPDVPGTSAQPSRQRLQRSPNASHEWIYGETIKSGVLAFYDETGTDREYAHLVVALAPHQIESIDEIYFNDKLSTEYPSNRYRINTYLGSDSQLADPDLVAESSRWTSAHRLQGIAYIYVRFQYDPEVWPNGIPNVKARIRGKNDVFDPRDSSTGYTENPALCIRDYMLNEYGAGASSLELDEPSFIAAANVCDEQVTTTTGNTETRFRMCGVISTETAVSRNLQAMAGAMSGSIANTLTGYTLIPGVYQGAPTVEFTQNDLTGAIKFRSRTPRRDLFNRVQGQFIDPDSGFLPVDFPVVDDPNFLANDNNEPITSDIDLPFTPSPYQAQRQARLYLAKNRNGLVVDIPVKIRGLLISIGQNVAFTIDEMGWASKEFRVIDFKYDTNSGVTLSLKEEDAALYAYVDGELSAYTPPVRSNLPLVGETPPPGGALPVIQSVNDRSVTGIVRTAARVSWGAPNFAFIDRYEVQWGQGGIYQSLLTTETSLKILDVIEDETYTFRVRAFSKWGSPSAWIFDSALISRKLVAPDAVVSLTGDPFPLALELNWPYTFVGNEDLSHFQIAEATTNDRGTAAFFDVPTPQLNTRRTFKSLQTRYYWIRPIDTSGNIGDWFPLSSTAGVEVTTQGGGTGTPGEDGLNGLAVRIFQRSIDGVNSPALPSVNVTLDFTTGVLTGLNNGWSQNIPSSGGEYLWESYVNATDQNSTTSISPGNWFTPGLSRTDGLDGVTSIPSFTPGLIGGSSNLVFQANRISTASANDGEVLVLGSRFAHPDGTERAIITNRYMATPLEGATTGRLYGMYTEVAPDVRFGPGDYGNSLSFVPVRYESGQWQIVPNTAAPFNFTPIATDCLVCIIEKTDIASSGIDRVISLLGGLQGEIGTDGFTTTTIRAYKRQSTAPTDNPGGGTYTVATGAITLLNGWSAKVPAGDPFESVYFVELDINTNQATQDYLATDWTAPDIEISAPAKSYSVNLINGNPDTPANSDGTGYDLSLLSGRFQVLENGAEVNGLATFSVVGSATLNGLTISVDADGDFSFSGGGWTSNGEVFTLQADYDGLTFTAAVNVTKKLSGAPGASPPVQLQVSAVGDFAPPPDTAIATYTLTDTGVEQRTEGTTTTVIGNWLIAGGVSDYECELLVNSGTTPTGSPTGSRIGLTGGRSWTLTDNTGGLPVTNNVTIRIFNATTGELLAFRSFPMSAEQGF